MPSATTQVQAEALRSLVYTSTSGSYAAVGTPLVYSARILSFVNNTDGDMIFSTDGTTDQFFLPKNSYKIFDFCTNRLESDSHFVMAAGTQFYVKRSTTPMNGSVYIESLYGINTVQYPGREQTAYE